MSGRDLRGGGQMLKAIRLDDPRRMIGEDVADPSLLGTGEHGGRYRSRTVPRGPVRVSSRSRAQKEPEWATARGLKVLEEPVAGARMILPTRRLSDNGLKAWSQAVHRGYEGILGKDPESPYVPGRTLKWLKVKQKDYREGARVLRPWAEVADH